MRPGTGSLQHLRVRPQAPPTLGRSEEAVGGCLGMEVWCCGVRGWHQVAWIAGAGGLQQGFCSNHQVERSHGKVF